MIRKILAVVLMMMLCAAVSAAVGPRVAVSSPVFDFGTILQGTQVVHRFELENRGDETLEIYKVETTCGCTVARDYPREIAPGKSGELLVVFNSRHKRGPQSKGISLLTNAPDGRFLLRIKGNVLEPVTVNPLICNFGLVPPGKVVSRSVTLSNHSAKPIHLEVVKPFDTRLRISVDDPAVPAGGEIKVSVAFVGKAEQPDFSGLALIRTDLPQVPVVTFRIIARGAASNNPVAE
ncbi:MAG: DUF1573 domain-containing protein [Deltaproteobacteria bacterium]|nr:DUF1573 domain-containing protein [Deltaproteobacteria bacterium]